MDIKKMNKNNITKTAIATLIIGVAVGYMLYMAADSSWVYYYTVDEFFDRFAESVGEKKQNREIRLAGVVKKGTVSRDTEKRQLDFELAGREHSLPVRYTGIVPNNFCEDREVVVQGKFDSDKFFIATVILTRCESKYKVRTTN